MIIISLFRDRQTKPGLVALYDIRAGNGAGPFLQPRSPHGASEHLHYFTKFAPLNASFTMSHKYT